jgi:predicted metal-dependent phosphoesterase TrpH
MILDLHTHSEASEDSRAPVETYLKWLARKRDLLPIDGIVLTEHRQWNPNVDYRPFEDQYGILILRGAEVETDYGHMLLYGVNDDIAGRFDFTNVRLPAQEVVTEVSRLGGIAVPCHPGRPTIGLWEHYQTKPKLEDVIAVEALNGGSRRGENERVQDLIDQHGYHGFGGSDSHLVSLIGICATEFDEDIRDIDHLVQALHRGGYRAVDFRPRLVAARDGNAA